jgi:Zn-dependent protease
MRYSLKIGTFWGIPVFLHWSFALILVVAVWNGFTSGSSNPVQTSAWILGLFAAMFVCVVLHEYGHALMARRFGVGTHDIVLTPIGGIARLEGMTKTPMQEFLVAVAGPAVNVVIALILLVPVAKMFEIDVSGLLFEIKEGFKYAFFKSSENIENTDVESQESWPYFWFSLLFVNCSLVLFNMIPAFPMDGGRVFRALMAMKWGQLRSTRIAAFVGQLFALLFVIGGFMSGSFMLSLIGLFVFNTARGEFRMVEMDEILSKFKAKEVSRGNFTLLNLNDWMQTPAELLTKNLEKNFLITDFEGNLVGTLGEAAVKNAIKMKSTSASVEHFYRPDLIAVEKEALLRDVYFYIKNQGFPLVGILENDRIIGVVDENDLDNFLKKHQSRFF